MENPRSRPASPFRIPALVFLLFALALPVVAEPPAPWELLRAEAPLASVAGITETIWTSPRPPGHGQEGVPADRIGVHRFRGTAPSFATLLYLPGTFMNGQLAGNDEDHEPWLFLARRGVEIFTLDTRTHAVPPETPATELDFMAGWNSEVFLADARAAALLARSESGRGQLFVAGFSRGAFFAYALAAAEPQGVAGILALDGFFKTRPTPRPDSAPTPPPPDLTAALGKLRAEGGLATDVAGSLGWEPRQALMQAAAADPAGPVLGDSARSGGAGNVGEQLARILHRAWGPGGLANPVEAHGTDGGGVSRVRVLARLLAGYDRYYPAVQDLEGRAIAVQVDDPTTPIDDGWAALADRGLPVLYFGTTGMGPDFLIGGLASAAHAGGRAVEIHVLEDHGHLDLLVGERARQEVFEPTLAWIARHRETPAASAPTRRF